MEKVKSKQEIEAEIKRLESERRYLNDFIVKMDLHKSVKQKTLEKLRNFDFAIKSLQWCLDDCNLPF